MTEHYYNIQLSPEQYGLGIPRISGVFGRITVLLGSNGTGKSRALRQIRDMGNLAGQRPVVYIEGGRVISIPTTIHYDYNTYNEFGSLQKAQQTFRNRRLTALSQRTRDAFYVLERREAEAKLRHSDAVTEWQKNGCQGDCPEIEESPLVRLFKMFSEVFPEIELRVEGEQKQIICIKQGQAYATQELSDGERQVLFVLADIALNAEPNSLILADEPELNLNPQLADRLWDTIENRLPEAVFIYTTHSINFALRQSVEKVFALSGRGQPAIQISSLNDIPPEDAKEFLGAVPAILATKQAVAVEGTEASFDTDFYKWILGRSQISIVPLGNCYDVMAATTRTGIWDQLASSVQLVGIIDRDYRDDQFIREYANSCVILDYHEAESYLCYPALFCAVASALGTAEHIPTEQETIGIIHSYFQQNILRIAVNRMASRCSIRLNVSLQSSSLKKVSSEHELRLLISAEADKEATKAQSYVGSTSAITIFDEELQRCYSSLQENNIDKILQLIPGKELAAKLAPKAGCKDTLALARATYKHINAEQYRPTQILKEHIQSRV